jgi:hypothetical protein
MGSPIEILGFSEDLHYGLKVGGREIIEALHTEVLDLLLQLERRGAPGLKPVPPERQAEAEREQARLREVVARREAEARDGDAPAVRAKPANVETAERAERLGLRSGRADKFERRKIAQRFLASIGVEPLYEPFRAARLYCPGCGRLLNPGACRFCGLVTADAVEWPVPETTVMDGLFLPASVARAVVELRALVDGYEVMESW